MNTLARPSDGSIARGGQPRALARSIQTALSVSLGGALGLVWGGPPCALAFLPLLFVVWWRAPTRTAAWMVATAYHLVAARSLIAGGARFFVVSLVEAFLIVVLGATIASVPWALGWCAPTRRERLSTSLLRVFGVLTLCAIPPIGAFCVSSPLIAAGVWVPGTSFCGLVCIVLVGAAMRIGCNGPPWTASTSGLAWLIVCTALCWSASVRPSHDAAPDITPILTHIAVSRDDLEDLPRQWHIASRVMSQVAKQRGQTLVLPEGAGGAWHPAMQALWSPLGTRLEREGRSALVGASIPQRDGSYRAGAVVLGRGAHPGAAYVQRVPMPFAMWRPWASPPDFGPNWLGSGTVQFGQRRAGVLVCWEMGSPWAIARSAVEGAEVLVGLANLGWLAHTGADATQDQALQSWGALFGLPVARAVNLSPTGR